MNESSPNAWLDSALGESVIELERRVLADALADVFGFELLQLGDWGRRGDLCAQARTQHHWPPYERMDILQGQIDDQLAVLSEYGAGDLNPNSPQQLAKWLFTSTK